MVEKILKEMTFYFNTDLRRINHALKVYGLAHMIAGIECTSQKEILITDLAAVLHDIGIKEAERKYSSVAGKYQEIEGPPIARKILESNGVGPDVTERVCYLVGNHHSYSMIDGLDFQILVEADFLVNIFEDGMDGSSIESVREKYFRTDTGLELISTMFGI